MDGASARCVSRCRTSATTCSPSPGCSTANSPLSRKPRASPSPWCGKPAFCTACPAPHAPTGRGGTGFEQRWEQVPRAVRGGEPDHGANTAQQFAGGEPQFAAAHLLHAAPPSGRFVSELVAVLPEPSAL